MNRLSKAVTAGLIPFALVTGCSAEAAPVPSMPSASASPSPVEASPAAKNILPDEACGKLAVLRTVLLSEGAPFYVVDASGKVTSIAEDAKKAVSGFESSITITDEQTGEQSFLNDPDAISTISTTNFAVNEMSDFLLRIGYDGASLTAKKNAVDLEAIQGVTDQARQVAAEALHNQCPAVEDPYKK